MYLDLLKENILLNKKLPVGSIKNPSENEKKCPSRSTNKTTNCPSHRSGFCITRTLIIHLSRIHNRFNFSDTGEIGDTIGGITAPIINITAVILVYYSFREQYRANKIQIQKIDEERQINYIFKLIDGLDQRIQLFKLVIIETKEKLTADRVEETKERIEYDGVIGIQQFCNKVFNTENFAHQLNIMDKEIGLTLTGFSELYHIVGILNFTAKKIEDSIIPSINKKDLIERLDITYTTALKFNLNTFFESFKSLEIMNPK